MGDIGVPELLIILAIAIAVFGAGRLAGAGKALGTSIKEFRRAIRDDEPEATATPETVE
ncbi:MAG TPA: twin-arginine translocase TatA/TatE family subunit, partial [Herpetosiphonaceae bacterium]|nr:twin-arginine translocase TatA/TatE family subunit [Herpetosiphonaceae bacterium]